MSNTEFTNGLPLGSPSLINNSVSSTANSDCESIFGPPCPTSTERFGESVSTSSVTSTTTIETEEPSFLQTTPTSQTQHFQSSSSSSTSSNFRTASVTAAAAPVASSDTHTTSAQQGIFLSTGVVAGAAIGCFLAGAVLAGIVFFLLLRRRKRPHVTPPSYVSLGSSAKDLDSPEKYGTMVKTNPVAMDALDAISRQPDDSAVRQRITILIDQIQSHVDNFYYDNTVETSAALELELSRFETSQLSGPLADCFRSGTKPTVLIQHCIAFHVFNLTVAPGEGISPLIPKELSEVVAANQYNVVSSAVPQATIKAYSQWKSLTAYLLPNLINDNSGPLPAEQVETVTRIATHFSTVFAPWSRQTYPDAHRTRHLVKLVEQAIRTATWLFSQADCYKFEWLVPVDVMLNHQTSVGEQPVIVAPSMMKVTHNGELLRSPQKMLDVIVKTA